MTSAMDKIWDLPAKEQQAWRPDWDALNAIWKRIDPYASKDIDITVSSDQIREMVFKLADERDELRRRLGTR
jgi:hypothetical protein